MIKRLKILTALPLFMVISCRPLEAGESALTLSQCYEMALKQSESLQIQGEAIYQFGQRVKESLSAILPKADFLYTEFWQDTSGTDASAGGVGSTLNRGERPEAKIQLKQPLFSGFREFQALKGFQSEKKRQELILMRSRLLLYEDVANAFYLVLKLERDLENTRDVLKLTQDRIKELDARVKLGKSRRSELLSSQSQLASLEGQEEVLKGQVAVAREVLQELTGENVRSKILADEIPAVQPAGPLGEVLAKGEKRTDLRALAQDLETKKLGLKLAQGALYPTASLLGNYYMKRVGFQEAIDWDLQLSVDLPLFQGGANLAGIRLKDSQVRQAQWEYRRAKRSIESALRRSYINLATALAQLTAFQDAHQKAGESYRMQVEEYRYGLVNNLDVLEALKTLQEAKKNLDSTLIQTKLNYLALQVAVEDVPRIKELP